MNSPVSMSRQMRTPASGPSNGHAGGHQRRRGAHDRDDVGLVDLVGREDRRDDLDLVAEPVGERRADRAVDHASGQRGLLARARLTLDEAAGELARGVHALLEVDRQREEVQVLRELRRGGGDEHDRLALTHEDGAAGLLGQLAGLEDVLLAVQFERFYYLSHELLSSSLYRTERPMRSAHRLSRCARPAPAGSVPVSDGSGAASTCRASNKKAGDLLPAFRSLLVVTREYRAVAMTAR